MSCQVPTAPAAMPSPPSAPLVKFPLLPRGLLSYLPANLSSILFLPRAACASTCEPAAAASPPPTTTTKKTTMPPAPASPAKKMSPPGAGAQEQQAGSKKKKTADAAELARVFELFDRNGDGRITREELEDSLGKLGIPVPADELAATIARIDANGDGCVDVEEFGELYRSIMAGDNKDGGAGEGAAEEEDGDMREAFRVFDANGDGYITVDELGAVLASLGLKQGRTAEECRRMIGQVDRDGDGRVDFHEFLQMMRGGGFAALG
ncbi:probable calcium-binding protein CML22 [Oryza brachyantha]|uniref:EF-hand domain-containing protein n=1 Tax=Oryza brachyantha TaxID=4533 RepID=J3LZ62_ORYBR|nr:probable calcium-binding protein CML22 [Oryza brachyantha]